MKTFQIRTKIHKAKCCALLASFVSALVLGSAAYAATADDISAIIAQNIKGTTVLDVQVASVPNDDGLMLMVTTSAGTRKFLMTRDNIVAALNLLQNPQALGARNQLATHHTRAHLSATQSSALALAKTQAIAPHPTLNPLLPTTSRGVTATDIPAITGNTPAPALQTRAPALTHHAPAIVSQMVVSSNQQASK